MTTFHRLGWIVAAAILGVIAASGFQGSFEKVASVDLSHMVDTSDLGKAGAAAFDTMKVGREGLLQFIDDNRVLTLDQAKNLRTMWLKDNLSTADKAALESLKAQIVAQQKRNVELSTKTTLTPEERTLLQEYASRSANMETLANQWLEEFRQEMRDWGQGKRAETLQKAKAAAQEVAKAQGFTLVFDSGVAVYAANDLTADALKAMNAKK